MSQLNDSPDDQDTTGLIYDAPMMSENVDLAEDGAEISEPKTVYKLSRAQKLLNYLLCRGDLAEKEFSVKPIPLLDLFRFAERIDIALLIFGTIFATMAGIALPAMNILTGRIANALLLYNTTSIEFYDTAMENVWLFGGVGAIAFVVNFAQFMCFQYCCVRITKNIRMRYLESLMRQNAAWFDRNHSGTLSSKLHENMERINDGIGDKLGVLIRGMVLFVTGIIISFCVNWRLALMMVGSAPLSCVCMAIMARSMSSFISKELASAGKAGTVAEESLTGVRTVQAFNGQNEIVDKYRGELNEAKSHAVKRGVWSDFIGGIFTLCLFLYTGGGVFYGGQLFQWKLVAEPGEVFTVVFSMLMGAYFLGVVSPHLMDLLNARVAAASIYEIIDRIPEIDANSQEGRAPRDGDARGKIIFENVHFHYPTRKRTKVLNDFNLVVEPGTSVALVGHSGCGKSTAIKLLTRLYDVEAGKVMIDGENVKDLSIDWLRKTVGVVQQEPKLFHDTILNNLVVGNPRATLEDIIKVCQIANAHEFIQKTPNGYETVIGEGGVQLSGGQKQRIAIARALIRNPKILLLDEATSALDAHSETLVQTALNNAMKGRTTIMVAHRVSTIREADRIVLLENGKVVESGNHEELLEQGGCYAKMAEAQKLRISEEEGELDTEGLRSPDDEEDAPESAQSFAQEVQRTIEENDKINAGYLDIFKNADGNYLHLIVGTFFAVLRGCELAIVAVLFAYIFEAFQYPEDQMNRAFAMVFLGYGLLGVYIFVTRIISGTLFTIAAENLILKFRVQCFNNLLLQDGAYFDNPAHSPGKLITRLATDAPNIKAVLDGRMLQVIYAITSITINLITSCSNCWQIAVSGTALMAFLGVLTIFLAFRIVTVTMEQMKNDEAGKISIEIIENVNTIQLLTGCSRFAEHYRDALDSQSKHEKRKTLIQALMHAVLHSFMYCGMFIFYGVATLTIYHQEVDSVRAFRAINAMILASVAVVGASNSFPEFLKAKTSAGMLFKMINRKSKTGDVMEGDALEIQGDVSFKSVRFSYPQRPLHPVLKNLCFSVSSGQNIALVGPTGAGKSTCISMLERFYDASVGEVQIDGRDIRTLSLYHLRSQMALVGQEPRLFAGTIKENVCFGLRNVPIDKVTQALELANVTGFLANLPFGIDTEVGEKGSQLSGGQKQRVAIARALLRDPKILLLDEATSALDSQSERAVQEALERARKGRTCITIAHRLSTIQNADLIVYIDNGNVLEAGNHGFLMSLKGKFYDLIRKQDLV